MAIIRELKGLWGVAGTLREITDQLNRPTKALRELVNIGLPEWDPPPPAPPLPPDLVTVQRVQEVIAMGTVEERNAFNRVIGQWRKITTGEPREPPPEELTPVLPATAAPAEEEKREGA